MFCTFFAFGKRKRGKITPNHTNHWLKINAFIFNSKLLDGRFSFLKKEHISILFAFVIDFKFSTQRVVLNDESVIYGSFVKKVFALPVTGYCSMLNSQSAAYMYIVGFVINLIYDYEKCEQFHRIRFSFLFFYGMKVTYNSIVN